MELISLFFPSVISLKFVLERENNKNQRVIQIIIKYCLYVLVNNWCTQAVIAYILNISDVTADAFSSFPFFIKYIVIASVIAIILPLVAELINKYFKISIETGVSGGEDKTNKK